MNQSLFSGHLESAIVHSWQQPLFVNGSALSFKLDIGADADVLPLSKLNRIMPHKDLPLSPTLNKLTAFRDNTINVSLTTRLHNTPERMLIYYVVDIAAMSILGWKSSESKRLISCIVADTVESVTQDHFMCEKLESAVVMFSLDLVHLKKSMTLSWILMCLPRFSLAVVYPTPGWKCSNRLLTISKARIINYRCQTTQ